jgi:hypothetical protein
MQLVPLHFEDNSGMIDIEVGLHMLNSVDP